MALIYRLFRRSMLEDLKQQSIPFSKFLSMQYNTVSWKALFTHSSEVDWRWIYKRRSTKRFLTGLALAIATVYAMILPTWLSTMTGYQAVANATLDTGGGSSASPAELQLCVYTIMDGLRVGLWPGYCVTKASPLLASFNQYCETYHGCNGAPSRSQEVGLSFVLLNDQNHTVDQPLLNVAASSQMTMYWLPTVNRTYTFQDLSLKGACMPQKEYQWGFSIALLFSFLIVTCALATWLYIIWLGTFTWEHDDPSRVFGELTSALHVAAAVHQVLGTVAGNNPTERELQLAVKLHGRMDVPFGCYRDPKEGMGKTSSSLHIGQIELQVCPPTYAGRVL
ncbi:hypothetical protein LTR81_009138 [Elasticomyces elasticus]